jgi:hypothetical protein
MRMYLFILLAILFLSPLFLSSCNLIKPKDIDTKPDLPLQENETLPPPPPLPPMPPEENMTTPPVVPATPDELDDVFTDIDGVSPPQIPK